MCADCRNAAVGVKQGDAALLAKVARRDRCAFVRLYEFYAPRLIAWFLAHGESDATAREGAQDVMLCVWRDARDFSYAIGSPAAWIYAMARDRLTHIREQAGFISAPAHPLEDASTEHSIDAMRDAMGQLRPEVAQALLLVLHQGMSHRAAAQKLGIPVGTLKSHVARGVARLRTILRRGEGD